MRYAKAAWESLALGCVANFFMLSCCSGPTAKADQTTAKADQTTEGVAVSHGWESEGFSIWQDPDTGCRYIKSMHDQLTPRMTRLPDGIYQQEGCIQ